MAKHVTDQNTTFGFPNDTKPTSVKLETINVQLSEDNLIRPYAKALVEQGRRANPLLFDVEPLDEEEVFQYCEFLVHQRVLSVQGECPLWRKLKVLHVPVWIQHAMSQIGEVILRNIGIRLMPTMDKDELIQVANNDGSPTAVDRYISYDRALEISNKLAAYENDLSIVTDAMPRGIDGNVDVMSSAMIADYVRTLNPVKHVASTYVARFAGFKLEQEVAFSALYRVQYDDLEYIRAAFTQNKGIL